MSMDTVEAENVENVENVEATEATEETEQVENEESSSFALLFDLEGVAVQGRKITFEVIKSILGEQNLHITPALYSRYCLYPSPEYYLQDLLDALGSKASSEKLLSDVTNGIAMHLASKETALNSGLETILAASAANSIKLAAFSGLPVATAESLAKKLGLNEKNIQLFTHEHVEKNFPRADSLLKIAKTMAISPRYCVVIASSQSACKSALSAGMRSIAAPDDFTTFQDFGGTEGVYDDLTEVDAAELVRSLCPERSA